MVGEDILERVEHEDDARKKQQGMELSEGDEPGIETVEPYGHKVARGNRCRVAGAEKNLQEVGHREGGTHGEDHAEHYKKAIQRTSCTVWLKLPQSEIPTEFHRL